MVKGLVSGSPLEFVDETGGDGTCAEHSGEQVACVRGDWDVAGGADLRGAGVAGVRQKLQELGLPATDILWSQLVGGQQVPLLKGRASDPGQQLARLAEGDHTHTDSYPTLQSPTRHAPHRSVHNADLMAI